MEFLKDILGEDLYKQVADAVNAHNGKPENKDKQVKLADLGSGQYVDKGKYDTTVAEKENLSGQIKTLNVTIGDLKKNNADNETLQTTITDLQTKLKDQQTANEQISKTYALKDSLTKQGVLDPDYLIYKAEDWTSSLLTKKVNGRRRGSGKAIQGRSGNGASVQTGAVKTAVSSTGRHRGAGTANPFAKETFNLTKQGEL